MLTGLIVSTIFFSFFHLCHLKKRERRRIYKFSKRLVWMSPKFARNKQPASESSIMRSIIPNNMNFELQIPPMMRLMYLKKYLRYYIFFWRFKIRKIRTFINNLKYPYIVMRFDYAFTLRDKRE